MIERYKYLRKYSRQSGLVDIAVTDLTIMLVGCGGIGSPTALALTKIGVKKIILVDPDSIEDSNLPNQMHLQEDIRKPKTYALSFLLRRFRADIDAVSVTERFSKKLWDKTKKEVNVLISGVDSIEARKEIWNIVKGDKGVLYLDARMAREDLQLYSVRLGDKKNIENYEKTLFPNGKAVPIPCTERSVIYNVFVIAGLVTMMVKRFVNKEVIPTETLFSLKSLRVITG